MKLKIVIPEKIRFDFLFFGAFALLVFQLITGTSLSYSLLIFLFVVISGFLFNSLGGLTTLNGFCMTMLVFKIVIVSQIAKVLFWQAGDSYLDVPIITAVVLCIGLASAYCAAFITRNIKFSKPVFKPILDSKILLSITVITYLIGAGTVLFVNIFGFKHGNIIVGGFLGIARQLTILLPFSIICATAYKIVMSDYRKSVGIIVIIPVLTMFAFGVLGTGKKIMFEPFIAYVLTCWAFRYPFRMKHIVFFSALVIFMATVLFPFAQVGRNIIRSTNFKENIKNTIYYVESLTKAGAFTNLKSMLDRIDLKYSRFQYYGKSMGLLDRFSLIEQDDELISATLQSGTSGWNTIIHGFRMLPPRFLYSQKPIYNTANYLGYLTGSVNPFDTTTQISFGFIAEAFCALSWAGVIFIPFLLLTAFFLVYKKLTGPLINNIWTVFLFNLFQHNFVEATISSMILSIFQTSLFLLSLYFIINFLLKITSPALGGFWLFGKKHRTI